MAPSAASEEAASWAALPLSEVSDSPVRRGQRGFSSGLFTNVLALVRRHTKTHTSLLKCGNGPLLQELHTGGPRQKTCGLPRGQPGPAAGWLGTAQEQGGAWPAPGAGAALAPSPAGRLWPSLPSPPSPLRTRTPGPQRGPLVTQQISVWQTGHLIQSQPPFFCTTMRQAGQCMASPSCTSVCRDRGDRQLLGRHGLLGEGAGPCPPGGGELLTFSMLLVSRAAASL